MNSATITVPEGKKCIYALRVVVHPNGPITLQADGWELLPKFIIKPYQFIQNDMPDNGDAFCRTHKNFSFAEDGILKIEIPDDSDTSAPHDTDIRSQIGHIKWFVNTVPSNEYSAVMETIADGIHIVNALSDIGRLNAVVMAQNGIRKV